MKKFLNIRRTVVLDRLLRCRYTRPIADTGLIRMYRPSPALRAVWRTRARYRVIYGGRALRSQVTQAVSPFTSRPAIDSVPLRSPVSGPDQRIGYIDQDRIENSEYSGEFISSRTRSAGGPDQDS